MTLSELMTNYSKELVAILSPFIAWFLTNRFQNKSKLDWSVRHSFTFLIQEPWFDKEGRQISDTKTVNTASISILNSGRIAATKIEVVLNWKPQYINVWPTRHFEEKISADGRLSIHLENLAPKEIFGFELLSVNAELPEVVNVRSEQSVASRVELIPQIVPKFWKVRLMLLLASIGLCASIYIVTLLIQVLAMSRLVALSG